MASINKGTEKYQPSIHHRGAMTKSISPVTADFTGITRDRYFDLQKIFSENQVYFFLTGHLFEKFFRWFLRKKYFQKYFSQTRNYGSFFSFWVKIN